VTYTRSGIYSFHLLFILLKHF